MKGTTTVWTCEVQCRVREMVLELFAIKSGALGPTPSRSWECLILTPDATNDGKNGPRKNATIESVVTVSIGVKIVSMRLESPHCVAESFAQGQVNNRPSRSHHRSRFTLMLPTLM